MLIDQLLASATSTTLDPDEFDTRYADLTARYETALATRDKLEAEIADRKARHGQGKAALDYLGLQRPLEYSDEAWALLVDHVNVRVDGELTVIFKDAAQPSS